MSRALTFSIWAKRNTQALIIGSVLLVLIVVGSFYYFSVRTTTSTQATVELSRIQQTAAFGERTQAKDDLIDFIDRYSNTHQAIEARLNLGEMYMEEGNPAAAIGALEPAARSLRNNPIALQAAALLASAYEEDGRLQDAEETHLRVAERALLPFQIQDALTSAARIRAERGDVSGAEALYQRLIDDMDEDDPLRAVYEMRLAEITAQRGS